MPALKKDILMANPKVTEAKEHAIRRARFAEAFNNAADILEKYRKSGFYKTFPQDDRGWELRSQFFMAHALNEKPRHKTKLLDKITDYLTQEQKTRFTSAYMRNQHTLGDFIDKLEPTPPQ